ncbi:MAG TPA: M20/M25/M40 family metallo-hydrolase [Solirubrobacteraceae bacterium]|nr:M20/M25/M40 family metallo-hydrolase [Solirubrobacteraceae bacterium]
MNPEQLQGECVEVLQRLVRFNTVNPPGNERPAIEYLERYVSQAGFQTEILGATDERPNLVADLRGEQDGPTLCFLGHVDTVLADAAEWQHDPWSGDVVDGFLWGRGSLDMKSQVAAEAVAGVALARDGWRPARGTLKLVFVADEETGGDVGAQWLTTTHADKVRCDFLLNEGGGESFEYGGRRLYGVCCAEKGVFRFNVTAHGAAGHASLPRTGDNALLKLAPVLAKLTDQPDSYEVTDGPAALLRGIGEDPADPAGAMARLGASEPRLRTLIEPMFGVTLTPTMASASGKINVIPSRAQVRVDCRVPPGLGEDAARRRIAQVLGEQTDGLSIEFTEEIEGNQSSVDSDVMRAIERWVRANDPGAAAVPVILPGFSDSRWFRDAFPDCTAYGFFPQRHQGILEAGPLVHNADERIDVRDLGFATGFFADIARELLG